MKATAALQRSLDFVIDAATPQLAPAALFSTITGSKSRPFSQEAAKGLSSYLLTALNDLSLEGDVASGDVLSHRIIGSQDYANNEDLLMHDVLVLLLQREVNAPAQPMPWDALFRNSRPSLFFSHCILFRFLYLSFLYPK